MSRQEWKRDWTADCGYVASSRLGNRELRVTCYEANKQVFAEVRLWRNSGGEWSPGNSIRLHLSQLPNLIHALEKARQLGTERLAGGES